MEGYSIQKLPDEPIIIAQLSRSITFEDRPSDPESAHQTQELLDAQEEPFFYIFDMSEVELDIKNMILAANRGAGQEGTSLRHPMIKELLVVTSSKLINLAAKGLNSDIFGRVPTSVFETVDDALVYARERITENA